MHTIILRNRARKGPRGNTFTIEVLGDSAIRDAVKAAIDALEYHPAPTPTRSLIDMLGLIERHNFQIRHVEHHETEDGLEAWLFVLQG